MAEAENYSAPRALAFQAEVKQLLDIVIHSLYTDKEIFVRELVSNAADALEKMRHLLLIEPETFDKDLPLEIRIDPDEAQGTLSITDTGIGMTVQEAEQNLGTIAHSGSREFLRQIAAGQTVDASLIGQFGVGFYSTFTVAKEVIVKSRSYRLEAPGVVWFSDGSGTFTVLETQRLRRGTTVTVRLKDEEKKYANPDTVKELVRRYSNFVPFPIFIKGVQVNTVQALWKRQKSEIKEEEYQGFYRFISPGFDEPTYRLHFNADVPLTINALLFFPGDNPEAFGFGRLEPGVSLYCRKVLIQAKAEGLLPEYFRFLRGVVDSEDLPLNISRETMQDSALLAKLKNVLTKRVIKFLTDEAAADPVKYAAFFKKFGMFIKEGVYTDIAFRDDLAKLLRYDSSKTTDGALTTLAEYIERADKKRKEIYFLTGPDRETVAASPYLEAFAAGGIEVLYLYDGLDDLVMTALREFDGWKLVSADSANIKLPSSLEAEGDAAALGEPLPEREGSVLARWIKEVLGDKVEDVRVSERLRASPAALVNPDDMMTTTMQKALAVSRGGAMDTSSFILEVNTRHPILKKVNERRLHDKDDPLARDAAGMLYDIGMLAAGLMVNPRVLIERSTSILSSALNAGLPHTR